MTYQSDCTLPTEFLKQLTEQGLESLPELIRVLVNIAMQVERQNYLRAKPFERLLMNTRTLQLKNGEAILQRHWA